MSNYNKRPKRKLFKKTILGVMIFCFLFISTSAVVFSFPQPAHAQWTTFTSIDLPRIGEWIVQLVWETIKTAATVVYKKTLTFFLNKLAYDSAVYIASGGKGQKPQFWSGEWGSYMKEVGDAAIGDALDNLSRDTFGFSICNPPNAMIKLDLVLKAKKVVDPSKKLTANCTFSKAMDKLGNVDLVSGVPDLRKLKMNDWSAMANYFKPGSNQFGMTAKMTTSIKVKESEQKEIAKAMRELNKELKPVSNLIGGLGQKTIETPSFVLRDAVNKGISEAFTSGQTTFTGNAVADAIGTFTDTLVAKFMERMIKGLVPKGGGEGSGPTFNESGSGVASSGIRGSEQLFQNFVEPEFNRGETIEVISTLSACPSKLEARFFNNCIIDNNFATAIQQKLTVQEAIDQNLIDSNKILGFNSDNSEPEYINGYPYSSLVVLRKYRIIPVTWELAALYIRDVETVSDIYTLGQIVDAFEDVSSPFYHLIDPNWVLKANDFDCRVEGPGQQILQTTTEFVTQYDVNANNGTGDYVEETIEVVQRADYCADERSCIVENIDGTCQSYGYCTKELPIWKFSGQACNAQSASCESFTDADGETISYLTNTLDFCNLSQVGCKWYSAYHTFNNTWADDIDGNGYLTFDDVYNRNDLGGISYTRFFNNEVETCSAADDGCSVYYELTNINAPAGYEASTLGVFSYVISTPDEAYANWAQIVPKFLKKAPPNLYCPVDISDPLRDPECDNYAQSCDATEVGCSLYTPLNGDPPIPAVAGQSDFCDAECVGYDQYLELATNFDINTRVVNLIPVSAQSCDLEHVGCEEFTNLDEIAQGGEGEEYFSYIRQCILPDDPNASVYYTWEGSDTTGYQLKTWYLLTSGGQPAGLDVNGNTVGIPNCTPGPANLDCRQFIDSGGNTYPKSLDDVIFATDDCHPYRRTVDGTVINGIKSLSSACPVTAVGCKEYRGNTGNVINILLNDDFEDGTNENWTGGVNSNESVYLNGHSLYTSNNQIRKEVSSLLTRDKNYTLSFWAKSTGGNETVDFAIQTWSDMHAVTEYSEWNLINTAQAQRTTLQPVAGTERSFGNVGVNDEWNYYRVGPVTLDRNIGRYEMLRLMANANVYFDNVIMREVTDNYYLVADSWITPAVCDDPFVGAQIGCDAYIDMNDEQVNLLSFTSLCSEHKVGCKALIETQNSESPYAETFNTANDATVDPNGYDNVTVSSDNLVYLTDNPDYYCNADVIGCTMMGEPLLNLQSTSSVTSTIEGFSDVYLIDFPENYNRQLCQVDSLFCEEFGNERTSGSSYFIKPGNRVCEYRRSDPVTGNSAGWYQQDTNNVCELNKVCSNNPLVYCAADTDCTSTDSFPGAGPNGICIESIPNLPVYSDSPYYNGWVASCVDDEAGCAQYLDPEGETFCTNNINVSCDTHDDCRPSPNNNFTFRDYLGGQSHGVCWPHPVDEVYYYLQQSTDSGSCSGVIDREAGCRLLNKVGAFPEIFSRGAFASSLTDDGVAPQPDNSWTTVNGENFYELNDSNIILKVEKDRVCDEWLYCRTKIPYLDSLGNEDYKCFDIGLCEGVNDENECNQFVTEKKVCDNSRTPCVDDSVCGGGDCLAAEIVAQQSVYSNDVSHGSYTPYSTLQYSVEDVRTMSGHVKAGMNWSNYAAENSGADGQVDGLLPFNKMIQEGNIAGDFLNGDFEEISIDLSEPFLYWVSDGSLCGGSSTCQLSIERNQITSGLRSAELTVLRSVVNPPSSTFIVTQTMNLPQGSYVLSADMRWSTVIGGNATIQIIEDGNTATPLAELLPRTGNSSGWEQVYLSFSNNSRNIEVRLLLDNVDEGDVVIDNIRIQPALLVSREHDGIVENIYRGQDCRMYRENNSPSCEYTKGSGNKMKVFTGWQGYCVETYPKNSKYCINWWPVDLVIGDIGDFLSETNLNVEHVPYPAYYCAESNYIDDAVSAAQGLTTPIFNQPLPTGGSLFDFPRYICIDKSDVGNTSVDVCNHLIIADKPTPKYLEYIAQTMVNGTDAREYVGYSREEFFDSNVSWLGAQQDVNSCVPSSSGISCTTNNSDNIVTSSITSCGDLTSSVGCGDTYCNDGFATSTGNCTTLKTIGNDPVVNMWNCDWDGSSCVYLDRGSGVTPTSSAPIQITYNKCSDCAIDDCRTDTCQIYEAGNSNPVGLTGCYPIIAGGPITYRGVNPTLTWDTALGSAMVNFLSEVYGHWDLYKWNTGERKNCDEWGADTCEDPDEDKNNDRNRHNTTQWCEHHGSCAWLGSGHRMWWVPEPCAWWNVSGDTHNSSWGAWQLYRTGGHESDNLFSSSAWNPSPATPDFTMCSSLALTAYESGLDINQAGYYQRLLGGYTTHTLGYDFTARNEPYGAVLPLTLNNDPTANPLAGNGNYVTNVNVPGNKWVPLSHSGCRVNANAPYTWTNVSPTTGLCLSGTLYPDLTAANGGLSYGDTLAAGITNIQNNIFARIYGIWTWNSTAGSYQNLTASTPNLNQINTIGQGITVNVTAIDNNAAPAVLTGGGTIQLEFTTDTNDEQLPIREYIVDWGDGHTTPVNGSFEERTSPADPHTVFHSYEYGDSGDCNSNPLCTQNCVVNGVTTAGDWPPGNWRCFEPSVDVWDNWGIQNETWPNPGGQGYGNGRSVWPIIVHQ